MSSSYGTSPFTEADSQSSHQHPAGLGFDYDQLSPTATTYDTDLLSPFNYHPSSDTSPSYNPDGTPSESASGYSTFQPSELDEFDEFFGVDFGAGVNRIDSISSALGTQTLLAETEELGLRRLSQRVDSKPLSEGLSSASAYPLSPIHTSIPNTPSPKISHEPQVKTTISQHELFEGLHEGKLKDAPPFVTPKNFSALQLTPDHSGSSSKSAEPSDFSRMSHHGSTDVNMSEWIQEEPPSQASTSAKASGHAASGSLSDSDSSTQVGRQAARPSAVVQEGTVRSGQHPHSRSDTEVPSLKQQEERRRIEEKNNEVQQWRSETTSSSDGDDDQQSYFPPNNPGLPHALREAEDEDDGNIPLVSDAASIRENRLQEGQIYYSPKEGLPNDADEIMMTQSRHWNDAPSYPYMTSTHHQAPTANEALARWNRNADAFSIMSRAATWGTRRRSETNLAEYDSVLDGNMMKKLAIKPKESDRPHRSGSLLGHGLERISDLKTLVRGNSTSNRLKRVHSSQVPAKENQTPPPPQQPRHNSQGSLAPPRTSSFGRSKTPGINTMVAAMTGPLAAVGTTHARSGSISQPTQTNPTSPKSPSHLGFTKNVMTRIRSKSDVSDAGAASIVGLMRAQGAGPPALKLPVQPAEEQEEIGPELEPEVELESGNPEITIDRDGDEEDDDDDEQGDDGDMKMGQAQADPIVPTYDGFKAHIQRLNPDMNPQYRWLISRSAHQQETRYKSLLDQRVVHSKAILNRNCSSGRHCVAMGGGATLLSEPKMPESTTLRVTTDFDEDNPGENTLNDETFPQGVPMPPARNLPAEFECPLCFKVKKFQKPSDWTKHVHEDVQPFTCTYERCKESKSFKRKADWVRHENERHRHLEWWVCQVDDCRRPCYRKDNFLQHLIREHKLPEPKQKTKADIKRARNTEPVWRMLEQCHHDTTSRPQDEPCKFCGKTFTTWKKLTVHLAKHMECISLPVLQLVDLRKVDAKTIISPVEANLTPITPTTDKMKAEHGTPFSMHTVTPHAPMVTQYPIDYNQPVYYPTAGPDAMYRMQPTLSQDHNYGQEAVYANAYGVPQHDPTRIYGQMGPDNMGVVNPQRQFPRDPNVPQMTIEQPSGFDPMGATGFTHTVPSHVFNYPIPQNYTHPQQPPPVSGFQADNMLGITNLGYGFNTMAPTLEQEYQQSSAPRSRATSNPSSYGNSPHNTPYFGNM